MDVMIDLETMGVSTNAAIVSIGALAFDRGKPLPQGTNFGPGGFGFYRNVDLQSCIDLGLQLDAATVMWWLARSNEARAALKTPVPVPVAQAMNDLNLYVKRVLTPRTGCVWSHGATFDIPIVCEIQRRLNLKPSWPFWNARDTRTLYEEAGLKLERADDRVGGHNAFHDCIAQVQLVQRSFVVLRTRRGGPALAEELADAELEEVNV